MSSERNFENRQQELGRAVGVEDSFRKTMMAHVRETVPKPSLQVVSQTFKRYYGDSSWADR